MKKQLREWPDDLALTDDLALYAKEKGLDPLDQWEAFHDSALANGRRYADWRAAWRTWCRNAIKFAEQHGVRPGFRIQTRIGFTAPKRQPEAVLQALADNEAAARETAEISLEQRQANLRRLGDMVRKAHKDGKW